MGRKHNYGGALRDSNGETDHAFPVCSTVALALALLL